MYESIDALYREHSAELTAALAVSTNDRQAAEDLAHEVFVLALTEQEQLLGHPNPRAWLFRTGYNLAGNRWKLLTRRRHKVRREMPILSTETWDDTIDLRRSLQRLSRRQRDAVILHYYLGFTAAEIGEMLGCAEGTIRSHLHRGRAALDQMLAPQEGVR